MAGRSAGGDLVAAAPGACAIRTAGIADDPRYAAFAKEWVTDSPRRMFNQPVLPAAAAKGSGHMSFVSTIIGTAERVPLPDVIIRAAIHRLCSRTATRLATGNAESDAWFADEMAARAIAEYTDDADIQHDEVPAAFFAHVLGPNR